MLSYPFSIFYYEIEKRKTKGRYIHGLPHILCKTMSFFASRMTPLVRLATTRTSTEDDMRRNANSIHSTFATASLTTCAVAMRNALFQESKISELGK